MKYNFSSKFANSSKGKRRKIAPIFIVLFILIAYITIVLLLPPKKISATSNDIAQPAVSSAKIIWPARGQAALGALNYGLLGTSGEQKAAPIASIAKTMVALAVLDKKPLEIGKQGPEVNMTEEDVNYYKTDLAQNGSVVPVRDGEKLTEYQLLQALLIPSGDNIATTLAIWAFGSVTNYLNYANAYAKNLDLKQTHFADASGLSPDTVSSARDLVILGEKILQNQIIREIVNQSEITLPLAGKVRNYNTLLGKENIIGIKTGNTDEAGGCFLFSATNNFDGVDITIIGAILGAKTRNDALNETLAFLQSNVRNFELVTVVKAGQTVASFDVPWGKKVNVLAKDNLSILLVNGEKIEPKVSINDISTIKNKGDEIGKISASAASEIVTVPLILDGKISRPSIFWRLFHP